MNFLRVGAHVFPIPRLVNWPRKHDLATDGGWAVFFEWLDKTAEDKKAQGYTLPPGTNEQWGWLQKTTVRPFTIAEKEIQPWGPNRQHCFFITFEIDDIIGFVAYIKDIRTS